MEPLTSLIRDAEPGDPLAVALDAVLSSGLIVYSRDSDGRFVQLSETLAEQVGLVAQRGDMRPPKMRVFNETGRPVPGTEFPASITRRTGKTQRNVRMRLVSEDEREIWLQMNTMPLERGSGGWSVLTIGADITDLQSEVMALREETAGQRALLRLAMGLCKRRVTFDEAVELVREPLGTLVPRMNVGLGRQVGAEYESVMIHQAYGAPRRGDRGRFQEAQRERWSSNVVHVNQDVHDTDIYGSSVVAEIPTAVRSLVVAPLVGLPAGQLAALWAHGEHPGAFSESQIQGLELIGRMLGGSMVVDGEELAQAS